MDAVSQPGKLSEKTRAVITAVNVINVD